MKASTAKQAVADLGNVLGSSDLNVACFQRALADTNNLVSAVYSAGRIVAAVAWTPHKKGVQVIAAAGAKGHATNLVAALEDSWLFCRTVGGFSEGVLSLGFFHWR